MKTDAHVCLLTMFALCCLPHPIELQLLTKEPEHYAWLCQDIQGKQNTSLGQEQTLGIFTQSPTYHSDLSRRRSKHKGKCNFSDQSYRTLKESFPLVTRLLKWGTPTNWNNPQDPQSRGLEWGKPHYQLGMEEISQLWQLLWMDAWCWLLFSLSCKTEILIKKKWRKTRAHSFPSWATLQ